MELYSFNEQAFTFRINRANNEIKKLIAQQPY